MTDTYEPIATRYRPQRLDELLGQETPARTVRGMLRTKHINRTILLNGPTGVGKTSFARIIAMAINCKAPDDGDPCGKCNPCRMIRARGSETSVHEINGGEARGIDEARKLIDTAQYAPRGFQKRVFILDECQQLTAPAWKSLLKVLEEPPPATVFILCTTDPTKIPSDIRGRMLHLNIRPVKDEPLAKRLRQIAKLEGQKLDPEIALKLARAAHGHVRDALNLLEAFMNNLAGVKAGETMDVQEVADSILGEVSDQMAVDFIHHIVNSDVTAALSMLERVFNHQVFCESVLRLAVHLVRAKTSTTLNDRHLTAFYEDMRANGIGRIQCTSILGRIIEAAVLVQSYQTNDPYAVMVHATVQACDRK